MGDNPKPFETLQHNQTCRALRSPFFGTARVRNDTPCFASKPQKLHLQTLGRTLRKNSFCKLPVKLPVSTLRKNSFASFQRSFHSQRTGCPSLQEAQASLPRSAFVPPPALFQFFCFGLYHLAELLGLYLEGHKSLLRHAML